MKLGDAVLIDTHAHLFWDSFKEDFDQILDRALSAGVTTIINVGVDLKSSKIALSQIDTVKWPDGLKAFSTIGIHPEEATNYLNSSSPDVSIHEDIGELEKIYQTNPTKVIAIGECGLDYSPQYIPSPEVLNLQHQLLLAQVYLAKKLNLPLLIHCRDAWGDIFKFIDNTSGILHCYSGDINITKKALQTNYLISFAGNITYPKNDWLRESVKIVPLERIVLETDCPFLPPQSKRGTRNEPTNILEIAKMIAKIKGVGLEEIAQKTTENAKKILRIS